MLRAVGGSPLTAQTSYQNLNLQKETLAYPQWATIHKDQNNVAGFNSIYGIKGIKNEGLFSLTSRVFDTTRGRNMYVRSNRLWEEEGSLPKIKP